MKKIILISSLALTIFLTGCFNDKISQPSAVNQLLANQNEMPSALNVGMNDRIFTDLIESPEFINQIKKIGDYYILQDRNYGDTKIYFLAKNYQVNKTELWNAAPTGIEQKGEFYLYQGKLEDINDSNVTKIGELLFSSTRNYFEIKSLKSADFVVIEQYEMNNFSRFYIWLIKDKSFAPAKVDGLDYMRSGWGIQSLTFAEDFIRSFTYLGAQPVDYAEAYTDYVWDGSAFNRIWRRELINELENRYLFYLNGKELFKLVMPKNFEMLDYHFSPDKKYIVYSQASIDYDKSFAEDLDYQIFLLNTQTKKSEVIYKFNGKAIDVQADDFVNLFKYLTKCPITIYPFAWSNNDKIIMTSYFPSNCGSGGEIVGKSQVGFIIYKINTKTIDYLAGANSYFVNNFQKIVYGAPGDDAPEYCEEGCYKIDNQLVVYDIVNQTTKIILHEKENVFLIDSEKSTDDYLIYNTYPVTNIYATGSRWKYDYAKGSAEKIDDIKN